MKSEAIINKLRNLETPMTCVLYFKFLGPSAGAVNDSEHLQVFIFDPISSDNNL
jgi:hypothetical protein